MNIFEELKSIPTSTLSDVLDALEIDGVITGVLPVTEGLGLCGPATTVREVSGLRGTYSLEEFDVGSVMESANKSDVIVFDLGGQPVSTWGGLATTAAIRKGVLGVVVDGGARDIDEIRRLKFPVFARHAVPTSGKTRVKITSINEPIECAGVRIRQGDIIVGDGTGLVALPSGRSLEILQRAREIEKTERTFEAELGKGISFEVTSKKLHRV